MLGMGDKIKYHDISHQIPRDQYSNNTTGMNIDTEETIIGNVHIMAKWGKSSIRTSLISSENDKMKCKTS